ncbi:uncharacterized protein LOC118347675 [Juglans regia]|uniref:Uncharacterized protein LOC118347675 n=1 Tax=Juglans regia TaxID=51240 RepID=A0A6P9EHH7_JUGRE|nr:uncharacterized protein LOC118347675 [Juglans regia]
MGDLNEILFHHEKPGGNCRLERQLADFRAVLEDCDLRDLGFHGYKFTWSNRREDHHGVSERLDRFLANSAWCNSFPNARVSHGVVAYSDYLPIWVELEGEVVISRTKRPFRFEEMWVGAKDCEDIIKAQWRRCNTQPTMEDVMSMIRECGVKLDAWSRHTFGHVQKEL